MKKKLLAFMLAACLLLGCFGCQSEQDEIYSQAMGETSEASGEEAEASGESSDAAPQESAAPTEPPFEVDTSLSGELTVLDCFRNSNPGALTALECLAQEFMERHPNVTVTVEYFAENYGVEEMEEIKERYSSQVRAELVSGEADYVLFAPQQGLNLTQLSESGVLLDLREYWDNDPDIAAEEYFTTVLDAVSVDGKLTALPLSFALNGVFLNRAVLEELGVDPEGISSVTCQQLLDWQEQAGDPDLQVTFGGWTQEEFFGVEAPVYLDLENKTASFDSPEFVEFLTRTGSLEEADTGLDLTSRSMWQSEDLVNALLTCQATGEDFPVQNLPYADLYLESGHPGVACLSGIFPASMAYYSEPLEYLAGPYPFVDSQGRLAVTSKEDLAVPSSIADPDLAWEFVKYCVGERDSMKLSNQEMYTTNFPLSKGNFQNLLEVYKEGGGYQYEYGSLLGFDPGQLDSAAALEKLEEFLALPLLNGKLYSLDAGEYLEEFYQKGLTTPEECAEKIQGRAEIWLNE